MNGRPVRRRAGPILAVLIDVLRSGRSSGSWLLTAIVGLVALAAFVAVLGQAVLPWLIYPAL